jgi:hypothetical protein
VVQGTAKGAAESAHAANQRAKMAEELQKLVAASNWLPDRNKLPRRHVVRSDGFVIIPESV